MVLLIMMAQLSITNQNTPKIRKYFKKEREIFAESKNFCNFVYEDVLVVTISGKRMIKN